VFRWIQISHYFPLKTILLARLYIKWLKIRRYVRLLLASEREWEWAIAPRRDELYFIE
jgi:hypothetical protein